jgi:hypothetical protein
VVAFNAVDLVLAGVVQRGRQHLLDHVGQRRRARSVMTSPG